MWRERIDMKAIAGPAIQTGLAVAMTLGLFAPTTPARAQATLNSQAAVTIQAESLGLESLAMLDFGGVEVGGLVEGQDGYVTVTPTSPAERSAVPAELIDPLGSAGFNAAEFTVTGTPGTFYTVNLPPSLAAKDTRPDPEFGVTELLVDQLSSYTTTTKSFSAPGVSSNTGTIGTDGTDTILIGGRLVVVDTAKKGHYRGEVELLTVE